MAVIKEVAERAGVSVGSVSKYLHHPKTLKPDTRRRIEAAIEALDYRPSPLAQSLRTGRTGVIAVSVPDIINPFFAETYSAIHRAAGLRGLATVLHTTDSRLETLRESLSQRAIRQVDGAIFCFLDESEAVNEYLGRVARRIPVVLLSEDLANTRFDAVAIDVRDGIRQATTHLAETGRRRIAYVGGPETSRISRDKHAGYLQGLERSRLAPDPSLRCTGPFTLPTGYQAARSFMLAPAPPDAIVAENDLLALGCLKYLLQQRIAVPGQVAVSGFDDISLAAMYEPALTTVAIPVEAMATEALAMVARSLGAAATPPQQTVLPLELRIRASSAPPGAGLLPLSASLPARPPATLP
jgi:DNA-binding LacI/PurR family transcriptional regulator